MTSFSSRCVSFLVAALSLSAVPLNASEISSHQASLNDGYSLFYDFCNQESELSLLLWVKTTPPDIADYARRISATAKEDMAILKKLGVNIDTVSLPPFEIATRQSMAEDRKDQLLWKSSGPAFAQAVAMTQSEVTNYGMHVAKILAETDTDPDRARAMRAIYDKWAALHKEAYGLTR